MFPRLAERKGNGGAQLSGGEQQMLAIGRALLLQPKLLVMDEPTEGLAPVIVEQVAQALRDLAAEGEIAVLLIEQNLGVAIEVADTHRRDGQRPHRASRCPPHELAADRDLQERLLGVRSGGHDEEPEAEASAAPPAAPRATDAGADGAPRARRRRAQPGRPGAAHGARLHTAGTRPTPRAPRDRPASAMRPSALRRRPAEREQRPLRGPAAKRPRRRVPGGGQRRRAPPTSPAPSTPRAASCSSCANAWRSSACASSRSTCRPRASRRRPACIRARWRATIRGASGRVHRRPRQRGQRRWRWPSSTSCRRGATWAASSPPAARAAPRWPRRRCARCRSACPR